MISSPLVKVIKTSPMKHYTLTAKRCHSAALESVQTVKCDPVFRLMGDDEEIEFMPPEMLEDSLVIIHV